MRPDFTDSHAAGRADRKGPEGRLCLRGFRAVRDPTSTVHGGEDDRRATTLTVHMNFTGHFHRQVRGRTPGHEGSQSLHATDLVKIEERPQSPDKLATSRTI